MTDIAPSFEAERERLTTPYVAELAVSPKGTFGIGFYHGEPQVTVPIVVDGQMGRIGINEKNRPENEISDNQKAEFILQLLTSSENLLVVVQRVFKTGLDSNADYNKLKEKPYCFDPRFTIAVTGPADAGKSNLVAQLGNKGWNVINLDAKKAVEKNMSQLVDGNAPPFSYKVEKRSEDDYRKQASPRDITAYSTAGLQDKIDEISEISGNSNVTIADTGGFKTGSSSRPDSPLTSLVRSCEIIIVVDSQRRSDGSDANKLVSENNGLQWILTRDFLEYEITGQVEGVADKFEHFLKENMNVFKKHVLQLRFDIAEAFVVTIKDGHLRQKIMMSVAEFGSML